MTISNSVHRAHALAKNSIYSLKWGLLSVAKGRGCLGFYIMLWLYLWPPLFSFLLYAIELIIPFFSAWCERTSYWLRWSKTQQRQVSQACPGEQKKTSIVQHPLHWLRIPPLISDSYLTNTKQQKKVKILSYPSLQKPVGHFKLKVPKQYSGCTAQQRNWFNWNILFHKLRSKKINATF